MYWQIAIDGPAAAGKSTIAKVLAEKLGFDYLDTGAMYRAITYKALTLKINMEDEAEYKFLESTSIDFFNGKIYLDGKDVSKEIRSLAVTNNASLVAKFGYVRNKLVNMQRKIAESKNIIMDGRDIGTVVLPNANLKIYLSATVEERAKRRLKEREASNSNQLSIEETIREIQVRDNYDMSREISPLSKAPDAIEIDTSDLSIEEVVNEITRLVMERGYNMESVKTTKKETVEKDITTDAIENVENVQEVKETKPQVKKTTKKEPKQTIEEEKVAEKLAAKTKAKKEVTEEVVVSEEKPAKETKTEKVVAADVVTEKKPAKTAKVKKEEKETNTIEDKEAATAKPAKKATKKAAEVEETEEAKPAKKATKKAAEVEAVEEAKPAKKTTKKTAEVEAVEEAKPAKKSTKKTVEVEETEEAKPVKKATKKASEVDVAEEKAEPVAEAVETVEEKVAETPTPQETDKPAEQVEEEVVPADKEVQPVREMQLVEGTVIEILKAKRETINQQGKTVRKEKEEKLLVKLDNGQEGYLHKKDIADIDQSEDLADIFMEGERIKVIVKRVYRDGGLLLSTSLIKKRENIRKYDELIANHGVFTAKVVRVIKVGLILEHEGYSCLLPNSQINPEYENYNDLVGTEMVVAPIRVDYNRIRLIVSQTVANAIINRQEKQKFLEVVEVGQVYDGIVKNIESYGAFVEIAPGVEGLLHISEIEHNRIVKVEKVINIGDPVKVKVIKVDNDHIGLSRKALLPNHWKEYMDANPVDTVVKGKIVEINRAGVVLALNENVQGFLPKSEFSWERDTYIEDYVQVDDEIEAKIIELDLSKKRIILSKKQLIDNPWETLKLRAGDKVEATVIKVLKEGVKISVDGASGFLPKSNYGNVTDFTEGETISAKVRLFDPAKTKLIITLREETPMDRNVVSKLLKSQEKVTNTFGDFIDFDELKKSRKKRR